MMIFSEDTEIAKSIPARIASYFVSLLYAGKPNRMACSILSPDQGFKCQTNTSSCLSGSAIHIKDPSISVTRVRILLRDFG